MPSKQAIIDNVAEYTPAKLASYIRDGIVSFEELCEEPEFSASARKEVKELIANSENDDWQNAIILNTIEGYDNYLSSYPEGKYRSEAREAKKKLMDLPSDSEIEDKWNSLDKDDAGALRSFIASYPESSFTSEAKEKLSQISRRRYTASAIKKLKQDIDGEHDPEAVVTTIKEYVDNGSVTPNQLYAEIQKNHNLINSRVIDRLEEDGVIDFTDLEIKA